MAKKTMINLERLQALMGKKRWGTGDLAEYSGVKYDTVYSIKVGRRTNTSAETLRRLADALDTTVDYLLGLDDEDQLPASRLPKTLEQLIDVARELPDMRQEDLLAIAEALAELERERQGRSRQTTFAEKLDLVEREFGKEARDHFAEIMRGKGAPVEIPAES